MGSIKHTVKEAVRMAAKGVFAAADPFFGSFPGPRILIYHQIGAGLGRQMEVTPEAFVAQMDWVASHSTVLSLDDAIARKGEAGSSHHTVLTFDDGYDDFFRLGYPELVARGLPFTLYLTTDPVMSRVPLFPGGGAEPLTWDQLETMQASGLMTLGAHTHRHPDLRMISPDAIEDDLGRSDEAIAAKFGEAPRHFAYPWGYWAASADAVVRARYTSATLGSGPGITGTSDPLLLHRVPVQLSDGVFFFKRKMAQGMRLEDIVRRRITRYDGV